MSARSAGPSTFAHVRSFLLLYAILGDTHLRHSQLKPLFFPITTVTHNDFGTFSLQDASGALEAQESLLEPPRCLQMPPFVYLSPVVAAGARGVREGGEVYEDKALKTKL